LVEWMTKNMDLTREQAVECGQKMLIDTKRLHHVTFSHVFEDKKHYYRFQEYEKSNVLNKKKIWTLPPRDASEVLEELNSMIYDLYQKFLSMDDATLDIVTMSKSKEFRKFSLATAELQQLSLQSMNRNGRLAFFLNMYNVLFIHGCTEIGLPTNKFQRYSFFNNVAYEISGHTFCLNDIEHGILRGNSSSPGRITGTKQFSSSNPRQIYVITPKDPRIHFSLNCGAKSCPPLRLYSPEDIDGALKFSAESFIENHVKINLKKKEVTLSKIFKWYRSDFAKTDKDLLKYICQFLDNGSRKDLEQLIKSAKFTIKYEKYEWDSMYNPPQKIELGSDTKQSEKS